jgi:TonB family protein
LAQWALPLWSLGVLLFSLRLVWASRQVSALRRQAKPAEGALLAMVEDLRERLRLARPVRTLVSAVADCPSVVGWLRPVVLLPAATILGLTQQQLEAVLAHELAHILRYDYLVNMLQTVVETLLFYHPAVWWASARIRQERELCCDDLAVESCGDALGYARALTRLERLRTVNPVLALSGNGGSLMYRIQRLAGDPRAQRGPSKLPGILALTLGLICFAFNVQWARGQQPKAAVLKPLAAEASVADEPGVQVDLGGASVIHRTEVEYPDAALEKGVQGTVVVEATLDAEGVVSDARVLSGPMELRKAALASVLRWHFAHGAAGATRQVSIAFQLPAASDMAEPSTDQRLRAKEARDVAQAKREQFMVDAMVRGQLAERMAEQAIEMQSRRSADASEQQVAARLKEMLEKAQAEHKLESSNLAQWYAEQALANQAQQGGQSLHSAEQVLRQHEIMADLQKRLAELKAQSGDFYSHAMFGGFKLKAVHIEGLSSALREELISMLPVHVGDILADDSMEKLRAVIQQFDEHLEFSIDSYRDQVEIRIAPGSRDDLELRQ